MKKIDRLRSKILLQELRLQFVTKKLPFILKVVLLLLVVVFILAFLTLLRKVDQKLSIEIPAEGGILREGIVGTPRFVNPVLMISDADKDLSSLIYSGLMRAERNSLVPDLAKGYEIDEDGLCYVFTLKENLLWSDDQPLTTDDILFTINQIKDPSTKSPKRANWEGVEVEIIDDKNISFCLQKAYAPFLENTTIGILPKHIWGEILPEQMSLSNFNINAVGSGPYKVEKISRSSSGIITSYTLVANDNFVPGRPYIEKIITKFYPSEKKLIEEYIAGKIDSLSSISPKNITDTKRDGSELKISLLPRIFAVFFNQDNSALFTREDVRLALELGTDKERIVQNVLVGFGETIDGPIPPSSLGFPEKIATSGAETFEERQTRAVELLEQNGWEANEEDGVLEKETKQENFRLEFSLATSDIPDLVQSANLLKEMWEKIGAKVNIKIYEIGDLEQNVIRPRKYDALLFGEVLGRDPDPFAFWHSSQRNDPGLNIALYANIAADKLLEESRQSFDIKTREEKYRDFQEEIKKDIPAVFLYSPHLIYIVPEKIKGMDKLYAATPAERFSQVSNWYINTKKIWKTFLDEAE